MLATSMLLCTPNHIKQVVADKGKWERKWKSTIFPNVGKTRAVSKKVLPRSLISFLFLTVNEKNKKKSPSGQTKRCFEQFSNGASAVGPLQGLLMCRRCGPAVLEPLEGVLRPPPRRPQKPTSRRPLSRCWGATGRQRVLSPVTWPLPHNHVVFEKEKSIECP